MLFPIVLLEPGHFQVLLSTVLSFAAVVVAKVSHLPVQLSRMHFLPRLESKGFLVSLPGHCDVELELEIIGLGCTGWCHKI